MQEDPGRADPSSRARAVVGLGYGAIVDNVVALSGGCCCSHASAKAAPFAMLAELSTESSSHCPHGGPAGRLSILN